MDGVLHWVGGVYYIGTIPLGWGTALFNLAYGPHKERLGTESRQESVRGLVDTICCLRMVSDIVSSLTVLTVFRVAAGLIVALKRIGSVLDRWLEPIVDVEPSVPFFQHTHYTRT